MALVRRLTNTNGGTKQVVGNGEIFFKTEKGSDESSIDLLFEKVDELQSVRP